MTLQSIDYKNSNFFLEISLLQNRLKNINKISNYRKSVSASDKITGKTRENYD